MSKSFAALSPRGPSAPAPSSPLGPWPISWSLAWPGCSTLHVPRVRDQVTPPLLNLIH